MPSARPVYLHIGLQKTGTSYLQSIFWQSQPELTRQGLDMVPGSKRDTFHLMLRVRGRYKPAFDPAEVETCLDRLPGQLAAAPGTRALLSEESLAAAKPEQIAALVAQCADREVHVVLTVRDLGRQIPSAWQELVQSGGLMSFERYLSGLKRGVRKPSQFSRDFYWLNRDLNEILDRWSAHVPERRIHIVTVPPAGAPPELLLARYCAVLGIDHTSLDRQVAQPNRSLGRTQAEVLRRVNGYLGNEDRRRDVYGAIGKRYFAVGVLGAQPRERIVIPATHRDWMIRVSRSFVSRIESGEFHVVGDLADLNPGPEAFAKDLVDPSAEEILDSAVQALARILGEQMEQRRDEAVAPVGWLRRRVPARRRGPGRPGSG